MAGGKETPRQKMIGMMYLVLTALLALNVSRAILDAFVAIEENIQISNENEWQRGDEKLSELKETAQDASVPDVQKKARKLLETIKDIDQMTAVRIREIDQLKLEILEACGEDISTVGKEGSIIAAKYQDPLKPMRMRLEYVEGKDKYDEPMFIMIGEDITAPKGKGMDLWKHYNGFRKELTEIIASSMPSEGRKFFFKAPAINTYKDLKDLYKRIDQAIAASHVSPDDREAIKKIYAALTKPERSEVHEVKNVHWIGKTFDHSPSVAALASLSSMQKEILTARADAISLIRDRVSGGEYAFNKIMSLAYGPEIVNAGEETEVEVLMAAYDSDRQPVITYNGGQLPKDNIHDGKGYIKVKGSGAEMKLSGTITILNKSGIPKMLPWEKTIKVMKPQGTISFPHLNVLYRGYANQLEAVASGYDETILSGADLSIQKSGSQYTVRVSGTSREAILQVSGKNNVSGKVQPLGTFKYRVMNLPKPSLYLGTLENGSSASSQAIRSMNKLFVRYPDGITLKADYEIVGWELSISGASQSPVPISGTGSSLSSKAISLLSQLKPGNSVVINVKFKGPNSGFSACAIKVQ